MKTTERLWIIFYTAGLLNLTYSLCNLNSPNMAVAIAVMILSTANIGLLIFLMGRGSA